MNRIRRGRRSLLPHYDGPVELRRLGYVSRCPPDLLERTAAVARLRVDAWVLPGAWPPATHSHRRMVR